MKPVGTQLKRLLKTSPFTLALVLFPFVGLALDVKEAAQPSSVSQELTLTAIATSTPQTILVAQSPALSQEPTQDADVPWVPLVGGGLLVLAIAATTYVKGRRRTSLKPSGQTRKVAGSNRHSRPHSNSSGSSGDDDYSSSYSDGGFGGIDSSVSSYDSSSGSSDNSSSCSSYDSSSGSGSSDSGSSCSSYDSSSASSGSSSSSSSYDSSSSSSSSYDSGSSSSSSYDSGSSSCSSYDSGGSW